MGKVKGLYEDLMKSAYDRGFSDGYHLRQPDDTKYVGDALGAYGDGYYMGMQQSLKEER